MTNLKTRVSHRAHQVDVDIKTIYNRCFLRTAQHYGAQSGAVLSTIYLLEATASKMYEQTFISALCRE